MDWKDYLIIALVVLSGAYAIYLLIISLRK